MWPLQLSPVIDGGSGMWHRPQEPDSPLSVRRAHPLQGCPLWEAWSVSPTHACARARVQALVSATQREQPGGSGRERHAQPTPRAAAGCEAGVTVRRSHARPRMTPVASQPDTCCPGSRAAPPQTGHRSGRQRAGSGPERTCRHARRLCWARGLGAPSRCPVALGSSRSAPCPLRSDFRQRRARHRVGGRWRGLQAQAAARQGHGPC